jgi:uncharacterized protein (TIGR00255 family)
MLKSMTGFGKIVQESDKMSVSVEIKSLNSKSLDIYCRLPRSYASKEIEVRNLINLELERGKVDIFVNVLKSGETEASTKINAPLLQAYLLNLSQNYSSYAFEYLPEIEKIELYKLALAMPNVYTNEALPDANSDTDWPFIKQVIGAAIEECNAFRNREGQILFALFKGYINSIAEKLEAVKIRDAERIPSVRDRLQKAVSDLITDDNFDRNRFEQELIYYIEKFDISEEKIRLSTHLSYFIEVLNNEANGKKLNFIAQEIGREINTIGSKANDAIIQRLVVEMKDELEKIKEQSMNLL